jgi:hypothetical protein
MKTLKITLSILLFVHIFSSVKFNLLGLGELKAKDGVTNLNSLGEFVIHEQGHELIRSLDKPYFDFLNFYNAYTGTNRGYSFFSPNVSPVKAEFVFYSGKNKVLVPLQNAESKSKLVVATYFLLSYINDEKTRNNILRSIAARLFSLNPNVSVMRVYLDLSKFEPLGAAVDSGNYIQTKRINAFTITRNQNGTNK